MMLDMAAATPGHKVIQGVRATRPLDYVMGDELAVGFTTYLASIVIAFKYPLSQLSPSPVGHIAKRAAIPAVVIGTAYFRYMLGTLRLALKGSANLLSVVGREYLSSASGAYFGSGFLAIRLALIPGLRALSGPGGGQNYGRAPVGPPPLIVHVAPPASFVWLFTALNAAKSHMYSLSHQIGSTVAGANLTVFVKIRYAL